MADDVAALLGVSTQSVSRYAARGLLPFERRSLEGHGQIFNLYREDEVKKFMRAWARGDDLRRRRWFDVEKALTIWRERGWLDALARQKRLNLREAEAIVRARLGDRTEAFNRRRRGRSPATEPVAHHLQWAAMLEAAELELKKEYAVRESLGLLEPR